MKRTHATVTLLALLVLSAGCAHCRWPWERSVTAAMPPATYPCGPSGPVAPGEACGAPALPAPATMVPAPTTTVVPGAAVPAPQSSMPAPALPPTQPLAPVAPVAPGVTRSYLPAPGPALTSNAP